MPNCRLGASEVDVNHDDPAAFLTERRASRAAHSAAGASHHCDLALQPCHRSAPSGLRNNIHLTQTDVIFILMIKMPDAPAPVNGGRKPDGDDKEAAALRTGLINSFRGIWDLEGAGHCAAAADWEEKDDD
jgi:hypothetical protein